MAQQNGQPQQEGYQNLAPPAGGRLFGSAMFGFNKDEVLDYLEELADANIKRQQEADQRIEELQNKIQSLESGAGANYAQRGALEEQKKRVDQLAKDLEVAKAATQQSEEELQQTREQLANARNESNWLREEYQKNELRIEDLQRQLNEVSSGQWSEGQSEIAELKRQLNEERAQYDQARAQYDAARNQMEQERGQVEEVMRQLNETTAQLNETSNQLAETNSLYEGSQNEIAELKQQLEEAYSGEWAEEDEDMEAAQRSAANIIAEANAEADRIRDAAHNERERIQRQLRSSAGGLAESVTNLRSDISNVEGEVSDILEAVQIALSEILNSLGRTEQNLTTLGVQVERYPNTSPPVPPQNQQQLVYFQPAPVQQPQQAPAAAQQPTPAAQQPPQRQQKLARTPPPLGAQSGFRRIDPEGNSATNLRAFRPSYTSGSAAPAASYEVYQPEENREERLHTLAESLVDTLRQMMDE